MDELCDTIDHNTLVHYAKTDPNRVLNQVSRQSGVKRKRLSMGSDGSYGLIYDNKKPLVCWQSNTATWVASRKRFRYELEAPPMNKMLVHHILQYLTPSKYLSCRVLGPWFRSTIEQSPVWRTMVCKIKATMQLRVPHLEIRFEVVDWNKLPFWRQFVKYTFAGHSWRHKKYLAALLKNRVVRTYLLQLPAKGRCNCPQLEALLHNYKHSIKEIKTVSVHEHNDTLCSTD